MRETAEPPSVSPRDCAVMRSRPPLRESRTRLGGFDFAIARLLVRMQRGDESTGTRGDLLDRRCEGGLVCARGMRKSADLADELQRRGADFLVRGRRLEVEQRTNAATHGELPGRCSHDAQFNPIRRQRQNSGCCRRRGRRPRGFRLVAAWKMRRSTKSALAKRGYIFESAPNLPLLGDAQKSMTRLTRSRCSERSHYHARSPSLRVPHRPPAAPRG